MVNSKLSLKEIEKTIFNKIGRIVLVEREFFGGLSDINFSGVTSHKVDSK